MLLRQRFRQWRQGRPFWGASLTILAGLELFVVGRFDLAVGGVVLQFGFAGLQTTIVPLVIVLAGTMALAQPVHHVFYGVIALALSVYSLVSVNLGGIGIGMLLGVAGSIVVVSWMGSAGAQASPDRASAGQATVSPASGGIAALLDDARPRDPYPRRSIAATLSVALATGGLAGALPLGGPCILGFILCDAAPTTQPTDATASPDPSTSAEPDTSPAPAPEGSAEPEVSPSADPIPSTSADPAPSPSAAPAPSPSAAPTPSAPAPTGEDGLADEPTQAPGLTVEVPRDLPLPHDEELPVALGGNEEVDVYAVPAQLKASDLAISGVRSIALVSVPVGSGTGERRNALKLVADRVKVAGFWLHTDAGADERTAGTQTSAASVTMDGHATMYLTSVTATGPDGRAFQLDADSRPQTVTSLLLAAVNPTIGLLGATSESQVWTGFEEQVWTG